MQLEQFLKNWEKENWILLSEWQQKLKQRLWQLVKLKKLIFVLFLFFIYLSLQKAFQILGLLLGFVGRAEMKFHISPEVPSEFRTLAFRGRDLPGRQVS